MLVKDLIQALSRFSPEARLSEDVDVQGVSPTTECVISYPKRDELEAEVKDLEDKLGDANGMIRELLKMAKGIKATVEEMESLP